MISRELKFSVELIRIILVSVFHFSQPDDLFQISCNIIAGCSYQRNKKNHLRLFYDDRYQIQIKLMFNSKHLVTIQQRTFFSAERYAAYSIIVIPFFSPRLLFSSVSLVFIMVETAHNH